MRLIDADKLKEKKEYSEERHEYIVSVAQIDWQPTIQPQGIDKDEMNTALRKIALLAMSSDETDCYDMELIIRQLVKLGIVGIEDGKYVFEFDEVEDYEVREAKCAISQLMPHWKE